MQFLGCPSHFWPNTSPASALAFPALSPMRFKPSNSKLALLLRFVLSACCLACFVLCTVWVFYFRLPVPLIWALCPDHRGDSREPLGLVETALGRLALDDLLLYCTNL